MDIFGYCGKTMVVDLDSQSFEVRDTDLAIMSQFVGGACANARLSIDLIQPGISPYSPKNPIVMGVGPFVGTRIPGASKIAALSKLPQTGTISNMSGGGAFASMLKSCGYDGLVIIGRAEKPLYLKIDERGASFVPAGHLWGKDLYSCTEAIARENSLTRANSSVLAIGPAGENRVVFSITLIDKDNGHLGKGGLGAVMGSKKLKAIVVEKGKKSPSLARPERLESRLDDILDRMKGDKHRRKLIELGIYVAFEEWARCGMITRKNWSEACQADEVLPRFGQDRFLALKRGSMTCPTCIVPCKSKLLIDHGPLAGTVAPVNASIACALLGARLEGCDLSRAVHFTHLANLEGLDAHELVGMIDFLVEVRDKGLLSESDMGGFRPERTFNSLIDMMGKIANREGFGDILAEGMLGLLRTFSFDLEECSVHFKGGQPYFDPRPSFGSEAFGHITNPRGHEGPVTITAMPGREEAKVRKYLKKIGCPEEAAEKIYSPDGFNVGIYTKYAEDWAHLLNSLGLCSREVITRWFDSELVAELYESVTGLAATPPELLEVGGAARVLERYLNAREGFDARSDRYPRRWLEPLASGPDEIPLMDYHKKVRLGASDIDRYLKDYYRERGWSETTGLPSAATLKGLGVDFADDAVQSREEVP